MNINSIENIAISENAYFYKRESAKLSAKELKSLFEKVSSNKKGTKLLEIIHAPMVEYENARYSFCVFKYESKPSFISQPQAGWMEAKAAYLLILEIDDYVIISKKGISGITDFIKRLVPLDYSVLSTVFIHETTQFKKLSMSNMVISNNPIRQKSVEASDLQQNFSVLGANTYVMNNMQIRNDDKVLSLSLKTSRVNQLGGKSTIENLATWSKAIIDELKSYQSKETFLSNFAKPLDYESEIGKLKPRAVLFLLTRLYEDYEQLQINRVFFKSDDKERDIDLLKFIDHTDRLYEINPTDEKTPFSIINPLAKDLKLRLNQKSITVKSPKLKKIIIVKCDGNECTLLDYMSEFILTFNEAEYVFFNKKLFNDSKLLGNIDFFLRVFKPFTELAKVSSEKGDYNNKSEKFEDRSIFDFVETEFINSTKFLICDDLGREWADHIGLTENKIIFIHSKFMNTEFSATSFQDIIGQTLKNLGNLIASDSELDKKSKLWDSDYKGKNIETRIKRLRKGNNAGETIKYFKELKRHPHLKREVYLVINFISESKLREKLQLLKEGSPFKEKNEVIQILWFISSLKSNCQESGVDVFIYCKP